MLGFLLAARVRSVMLAVRAPDRQHHIQLHAGAGLLVMALVLFAVTDNPMVHIGHFMTPLAAVLGLSDAIYQRPRARACGPAAPPAPRTLAASPTGYGMGVTERRK